MTKKIKLYLGILYLTIIFIFLYFIFSKIETSRLNDFSYYKELQIHLDVIVGNNLYFNLFLFFIFCIIWTVLLGFGSPITIFSGILFGKWIGTLISVISVSLGALTLYIITSYFFQSILQKILKGRVLKYIHLFRKNEFYYFFFYRFVGGLGLPFFLQNTLPVIFNMKRSNYFFATLLGLIPGFFVFNAIGAGINEFIKQSDSFSLLNLILTKEIYYPISMFLILIIISIIAKKKIFDVKSK